MTGLAEQDGILVDLGGGDYARVVIPVSSGGAALSLPVTSSKAVTFTGAAGAGAQGTVTVFTVTGRVAIQRLTVFNTVTCVGATATLALGVTGNTTGIIAATAITQFVGTANAPGLFWDATGTVANMRVFQTNMKDIQVARDVIITVATADVTAGVLLFSADWVPISSGATLVAA